MAEMEWPPQYTIKRHWRARHVKMTYSAKTGLEITLPLRFSTRHLPSIIEENRDWILNQKSKHDKPDTFVRPTEIVFLAINQRWTVHYFQNDKNPRVRAFSADGIILSGDIKEFEVCRAKLSSWIVKQAKIILPQYFSRLAAEMGISYRDVSIRGQSSIWGSCSQDKSIRLNYKLLFLPEALMRHIMIHELCHTKCMDHSARFWQLVASFDHHWQAHKKAMKKADDYMPAWI